MIAAIVVPLGWRSRPSTVPFFDEPVDASAALEAAVWAGGNALAGVPFFGVDRLARGVEDFDFGFALRVAIWLSIDLNNSIVCCH